MGAVVQFQKVFGVEMTSWDNDGDIIPQPISGWLDLRDHTEVGLSITVFERHPAVSLGLLIQTATVPEGPWTTVAAFTRTPAFTEAKVFLTSKEGADLRFERYLRSAADAQFPGNWRTCFKIDAIVR